jgi:hypothetical protein
MIESVIDSYHSCAHIRSNIQRVRMAANASLKDKRDFEGCSGARRTKSVELGRVDRNKAFHQPNDCREPLVDIFFH